MKIKQHVVISNPDKFLQGNYSNCFNLLDDRMTELMVRESGWVDCGDIELDIDVSGEKITASILKALDAEIKKERAERSLKMDLLQTRKDELLALTHEPNPAADFERDSYEGAA